MIDTHELQAQGPEFAGENRSFMSRPTPDQERATALGDFWAARRNGDEIAMQAARTRLTGLGGTTLTSLRLARGGNTEAPTDTPEVLSTEALAEYAEHDAEYDALRDRMRVSAEASAGPLAMQHILGPGIREAYMRDHEV